MATENQIDSSARCSAQDNGIVRQQKFEFRGTRSGKSQRQIFETNHRVVDTGQPKRSAVPLETHTLVNQNGYAFRAKQVSD